RTTLRRKTEQFAISWHPPYHCCSLWGVQHQRDKLSRLRTVGHTAGSIDVGGTAKTRVRWKRDRQAVNAGVLYKRNLKRRAQRSGRGFVHKGYIETYRRGRALSIGHIDPTRCCDACGDLRYLLGARQGGIHHPLVTHLRLRRQRSESVANCAHDVRSNLDCSF